MKQKRFLEAVKRVSEMLHDFGYKCASRQKQTYFSREGNNIKLGFVDMVTCTLNFLAKSTQTELNRFFEHVIKSSERVSKQAFAQARFKLTVDAFRLLFFETAKQASVSAGLATFKVYRVLPIDGTTLRLEDTYALRSYFGVEGGERGGAAARASVVADVLNGGLILDAQIDKLSCGERALALRHLAALKELELENPLPIFDRGYASADMFDALGDTAFLFRLQRSFNAQIDRMAPGDCIKSLKIKGREFRLRVLKFALPSGEVETLVTNQPKSILSSGDLKELYRLRWGVETAYRTIKSALQIENFTGTSRLLVEQDFFATMFLKNMVAFAKLDADEIIAENEKPENLYRQQTNINQLIGLLKDKLALALLETSPRAQQRKVAAIIRQAASYTVPIRPARSSPRKRKSFKRFSSSAKSAL